MIFKKQDAVNFISQSGIVFDPPINKDTIGKLSPSDKKKIIRFISVVTGIDEPSEARILDFLKTLDLK